MKLGFIAGALVLLINVAHAQTATTTTHPPTATPSVSKQMPPASMTCAGDRVVWVNTASKVYHTASDRYYGATKQGKFLCEKAAIAEGDRAPKK